MKTWNYRVFKTETEGHPDDFAIHEVYYEDGKPVSLTVNPIAASGESLEEVGNALKAMQSAIELPVLSKKDFSQ